MLKWGQKTTGKGNQARRSNATYRLIDVVSWVVSKLAIPLVNKHLASNPFPLPSSKQVTPSNSKIAFRKGYLLVASNIKVDPNLMKSEGQQNEEVATEPIEEADQTLCCVCRKGTDIGADKVLFSVSDEPQDASNACFSCCQGGTTKCSVGLYCGFH